MSSFNELGPVTDPPKPEYLGDGLYAEYNGESIRLFASDGVTTLSEVFLDPPTLRAFLAYVGKIREAYGNT